MDRSTFYVDWVILISVILIVSLGLATLLSISQSLFYQQLIALFFAVILLIIFAKTPFFIYQYFDFHIFFICMVILVLTFLGPQVRGATRWIEFGTVRIQPSELIKPFFLVSIACLIKRYNLEKLKNILLHTCLILIPLILIIKQPDLGNGVVYLLTWLGMIILGGMPLFYLLTGSVLTAVFLPLVLTLLKTYQKARLVSFFNPFFDPSGAGYNAIQSLIAVGSGQIWGRGFGRGTQSLLKFLPERHTDFIFASFVEEFGFLGGVIVLGLFFLLLFRMLKLADKQKKYKPAWLYINGFFLLILSQTLINIGMNIGLLPITGITLPWFSYGGSSIVTCFIGLGILFSASNEKK